MRQLTKTTAINRLALIAIQNLPESISERRATLESLLLVLPQQHSLREKVKTLQSYLENHTRCQLMLQMDFQTCATESTKP